MPWGEYLGMAQMFNDRMKMAKHHAIFFCAKKASFQ
jgi:hypothetical protein